MKAGVWSMISGNKIKLRLFKSETEVQQYYEAYNQINRRAVTDHSEIIPGIWRLADFRKSAFWTQDHGVLLIENKEYEVIGTISFQKNSDFELEIGYRIRYAAERGRGYGTEALQLFVAYLFNSRPHITRVQIRTAENNLPSRCLAEKCGFL